jgi:hypothetical protein
MQKRIREKLATKYSKIEVLNNYWDKIVGIIGLRAQEYGDLVSK